MKVGLANDMLQFLQEQEIDPTESLAEMAKALQLASVALRTAAHLMRLQGSEEEAGFFDNDVQMCVDTLTKAGFQT